MVGVLVGGSGVLVTVLVGVLVGGSGVLVAVLVGVLVGGSGVLVAVLVGVLVGGRGLLVAVLVGVYVGVATISVGVGVGLGRLATAESTCMRGIPVTVPPLRVSLIDTPVLVRVVNTASTEAPGSFDFNTAQAPVTWGADIEVPLFELYKSPGTDEVIDDPGASSEMKEAIFEKDETVSEEVVDPTLIAVEIHAGAPIALV